MADTVNGEPARSGPDRASTLGLVLDGGLGRRMGGADKGFVTLAGRPMLAHAIERLRPQCESLAISANGDATRFASFACRSSQTMLARLHQLAPIFAIFAGSCDGKPLESLRQAAWKRL